MKLISPSNTRGLVKQPFISRQFNKVVNSLTTDLSKYYLYIGNVVHYAYELMLTEKADMSTALIESKIYYDMNSIHKNGKFYNDMKPPIEVINNVMLLVTHHTEWLINTVGKLPQLNEVAFLTKYNHKNWLGGTADILIDNGNGTHTIADIKNYSNPKTKDLRSHYTQCLLYSKLANDNGYDIKDIKLYYPAQEQVITLPVHSI
jgi:hypothetical protein